VSGPLVLVLMFPLSSRYRQIQENLTRDFFNIRQQMAASFALPGNGSLKNAPILLWIQMLMPDLGPPPNLYYQVLCFLEISAKSCEQTYT